MRVVYSNLQEQLWLELTQTLLSARDKSERHLLFFPSEALKNYYQSRLAECLDSTVDIDCCLLSEVFELSLELGLCGPQPLWQEAVCELDFEAALTLVLSDYLTQLKALEAYKALEEPPTTAEDLTHLLAACPLGTSSTPLTLDLLHSPLIAELSKDSSPSLFRLVKTLATSFSRYAQQATSSSSFYKPGDWQSSVWQDVMRLLRPKASYVELLEQLAESSRERTIEGLHFHFIGFSRVPPILLSWIKTLALHYPVQWFFLSPSRLFWSDIESFFSNQKTLAQAAHKASIKTAQQLESILFDRHPLLANMAQASKPLAQFLEEHQSVSKDAYVLVTDPHLSDLYLDLWWQQAPIEPAPPTLLRALQLDFLLLRTPHESQKVILKPDLSLVVHQCPDLDWEVLSLKAHLLRRLREEPSLELADILILAPDIHIYHGLIEKHFEKNSLLPYRIHDCLQLKPQGPIRTLQRLVLFAMGTWSFSSYVELLSLENLSQKYDSKQVLRLLENAQLLCRVHWGIDEEHRRILSPELGLVEHSLLEGTTWERFWEIILKNLLQGSEEFERDARISFWGSPVLSDAFKLHQQLLELLKPWYRRESLSLKTWVEKIQLLFEAFCLSDGFELEKDRLEELLGSLVPCSNEQVNTPFISCESFQDLFLHRLESISLPWSSLDENSLRFSSMQPMRSVPAKHICILGLSGDMRAKIKSRAHFEWSLDDGIVPLPSPLSLDRSSFLETLLSARESLHLFYSQTTPNASQDSIEPSYLISELIGYLDQNFAFSDPSNDHFTEKTFSQILHLSHGFTWQDPRYQTWPWNELFALEAIQQEALPFCKEDSLESSSKGKKENWLLSQQQIVSLLTDPLGFHLTGHLKSLRAFYTDDPLREHELDPKWSLKKTWMDFLKKHASVLKENPSSLEKILAKQSPSSLTGEAWMRKIQDLEKTKTNYWKIYSHPKLFHLSVGFDVLGLPKRLEDLTAPSLTLSPLHPWKLTGPQGWVDPIHPHIILEKDDKKELIGLVVPYLLAHHLGLLQQSQLTVYSLKKLPRTIDLSSLNIAQWLIDLACAATYFHKKVALFSEKQVGYLFKGEAQEYLCSLLDTKKESTSLKRIILFLETFGLEKQDPRSEKTALGWMLDVRGYLLPLWKPFLEISGSKLTGETSEEDA